MFITASACSVTTAALVLKTCREAYIGTFEQQSAPKHTSCSFDAWGPEVSLYAQGCCAQLCGRCKGRVTQKQLRATYMR